ncbi:hypothetical protein K9M78_00855 [Candidatus Bipolaricaulota bacterium]|nr:hypothetical protein [Candidatus Bipolaricaulota bacterium]
MCVIHISQSLKSIVCLLLAAVFGLSLTTVAIAADKPNHTKATATSTVIEVYDGDTV